MEVGKGALLKLLLYIPSLDARGELARSIHFHFSGPRPFSAFLSSGRFSRFFDLIFREFVYFVFCPVVRNDRILEANTMRFLAFTALLILAAPCLAQEDLHVLPAKINGAPTQKMLYNFLLGEVRTQLAERKKEVAALKTPEEFKQRQARLKQQFIDALGGYPEKTPLNAKVVGKMDRDDYRIEKVIYESQPNHHVTATLFIPTKGKGPFPGVLVPCGHSANGKAAETYQRASILLAKNGFVVLCYDPIGQGERLQSLNKMGKPAVPGSTSEHTMVGVGALLVGKCTATYRIWDGIRSMDYLASRPEVDAKRLGCTGNSGGGTLTAYLMALDERIVAAAPSCYITTLDRLFSTIGPQDAEQNIPGQVAFGLDHVDYVTLRAPRPTILLCGTQDYFNIDGVWETFREAKLMYGMLGFGERVSIFEYNDKHGFWKPRREAAVRWMCRWLQNRDEAIFEPDFDIFTDAELQCTRSGQVLSDFNGKSVFHLNAELEKKLAPNRNTDRWGKSPVPKIRQLIGLPEKIAAARVVPQGMVQRKGYTIYTRVFETEPGIFVPGLQFVPAKPADKKPLLLYVPDNGMATDAKVGGRLEQLTLAGNTVLAVDLRGLGETAPGSGKTGMAQHFGADWQEAFLGMHLNRPLLGQRVLDVLAIVELVSANSRDGVHVLGTGTAGPVALHAAAFDKRIVQITVEKSLTSWADVVHTPVSRNQLSNVVPGVLGVYDLPELAWLLAPRPLTIRQSVDAAGNAVTQANLDKQYQTLRGAYSGENAKKLVLQAGK
jgi:cephalosporin-C deacetylase-like acetyl esterase